MTTPFTPLPNPGGTTRQLVRTQLQEGLQGLSIPGVVLVYRSLPPTWQIEEAIPPGARFAAALAIQVGRVVHKRTADTGPTDPGGKTADHDCVITLYHRGFSAEPADWEDAEDDHDRILGAVLDYLSGGGRDLGRPDVILQAADWPNDRSVEYETTEPVWNEGVREQVTDVSFLTSIYMQRQP